MNKALDKVGNRNRMRVGIRIHEEPPRQNSELTVDLKRLGAESKNALGQFVYVHKGLLPSASRLLLYTTLFCL